jgi:hypothetical protein
MKTGYYTSDRAWKLPPLILHPFSDVTSPQKLVQSSRANLMLQGLLPNDLFTPEQLELTLLEGRYCEIRMLYYVGKDLVRWIDQCAGIIDHEAALRNGGVTWQSFASLVVEDPPTSVREKLTIWGVADYRTIFSRAIGLNSIFADAPERSLLTDDFVRNYHQYADQMFSVKQSACTFTRVRSSQFAFDMYASGEYSRLLERQWQEEE